MNCKDERVPSQTKFGKWLKKKGFKRKRDSTNKNKLMYIGLALRENNSSIY